MTDSKYFTTTKKGEIFELKSELNSDKKEKKREAVKKVKENIFSVKSLHAPASLHVSPVISRIFLSMYIIKNVKNKTDFAKVLGAKILLGSQVLTISFMFTLL